MDLIKSYPRIVTFVLLLITILYCHQIWKKITGFYSPPPVKKEMVTYPAHSIFDTDGSFEEKANTISEVCFRKLENILRDDSYFIGK